MPQDALSMADGCDNAPFILPDTSGAPGALAAAFLDTPWSLPTKNSCHPAC